MKISQYREDFIRKAVAQGHVDAGETALFDRALTHTLATGLEKQYPELKARSFIPLDNSVPSGANNVEPWSYEGIGKARVTSNYNEAIPRVTMVRGSETIPVLGIDAEWAITVPQIRAAAMAGFDLDSEGLSATIKIVEKGIDDLLTTGNAERGVEGLATHSDITPMSLTNGTWSTPRTAAQIVADVQDMLDEVISDSSTVYEADSLAMAPSLFSYLSLVVANTSMTIYKFLLENTSLTSIEKWQALETAGASSDPRIICYKKDKTVLQGYIPQEVEVFPVQTDGYTYKTIVHARCAGVSIGNATGIQFSDDA
jgi:hypothetical protein